MVSVVKVEVILTVPSIEDTAAWYERVLGWRGGYDVFDAQGRCTFGSVFGSVAEGEPFRGFNLSRYSGEPPYEVGGEHVTALIEVDDVDALYARAIRGGATPGSAPADQPWGSRTFAMRDLNGFVLTFHQPVEEVTLEEIRQRYQALGKQEGSQ